MQEHQVSLDQWELIKNMGKYERPCKNLNLMKSFRPPSFKVFSHLVAGSSVVILSRNVSMPEIVFNFK